MGRLSAQPTVHMHSGCTVNPYSSKCWLSFTTQNVIKQHKRAVCFRMREMCVFVLFTGFSAGQPGFLSVPLAYTTKLPAPRYGGVEEAKQWLPSGHYEDQLYEVELQSLAS